MRIEELVRQFSYGATHGSAGGCAYGMRNLRIEGDKLFNYYTIIALRTEDGVILNNHKYSSSTSRIQNYISYYCNVIKEVDGAEELIKYGA